MDRKKFLPLTVKDLENLGWDAVDFIIISGDAYVDHPSFGAALIGRILLAEGFSVGLIPQPDWRQSKSFQVLGKPKLAFLITGGNIDSMVNHYTAAKKPRSSDLYSPGGKKGLRPDRAVIVYAQKVKEAYKDVPVIIGGIEASLRRFAHYDYWDNKVRRSVLFDAKADLLVYGMAEKQVTFIARALSQGSTVHNLNHTAGTCYISNSLPDNLDYVLCPGFAEVNTDKLKYAEAFKTQAHEQNPFLGKAVVQPHGDRFLVQLPPASPLTQQELDAVYALPFQRAAHPIYAKEGGVPALNEVEFSITSHRGCYGGCSFCALTFHQGRIIQNRSVDSIVNEAQLLTALPGFKGYIHDIGGPTANFRKAGCKKQLSRGACQERQCLFPEPCPNLEIDHQEYLGILRRVRSLPGIKKVFVRSGLRYDYLLYDTRETFFNELCRYHISGQLKVAPEHVAPRVLELMGKPPKRVYDKFVERYQRINKKLNKKQFLVPYFISGHPGSTLRDAVQLAEYIRDMGYNPEQVQDFIPTPGSLATTMYYTGLDPKTMKKIYVPGSVREKALQRALLQYRNPQNYALVYEALIKAGRKDLIGFGPQALIKPPQENAGSKSSAGIAKSPSRLPNQKGTSLRAVKSKGTKQKDKQRKI
ncbi:MAG: YgiQ family radical SAM protein [Peptococcaceae bacterium]